MIGNPGETVASMRGDASVAAAPDVARLQTMYRDLWRIRRFEERAMELFASGAIKPKGDRLVQGKTELDEVIRAIVS